MLKRVLLRHNVHVFFLIRRDLLRSALSNLRGELTGNTSPQFRLANGELDKQDLKPVTIDIESLKNRIDYLRATLIHKKEFAEEFSKDGIPASFLTYESFCEDKISFFRKIHEDLKISISDERLQEIVMQDIRLKKVHSNDISEFVVNHEEVTRKFAHEFFSLEELPGPDPSS